MKKMNLAKILIQGAVTIAFAGGIYFYTQVQVKPQEIYKFNRDLSINTVIQESDLKKEYIPKDAVTPDMVIDKKAIVGKAVSTKSFAGQYIIKQQLISPTEIDPFATMDLTNYRKVSFSISSKDAIGGNIKRHDKIDLLSIREGEVSGASAIKAKTFMQNVLVYNVLDGNGHQYKDTTEGENMVLNDKGEAVETGELSIITVAVPLQQAEELEAMAKSGAIKVVGRFDDSVDVSTPGTVIIKSKF